MLFLVSGASARYALDSHSGKAFFAERTRKLLVPSALGLLVLGWAQGYFNMAFSHAFENIPSGVPAPVLYLIMTVSGIGVLWTCHVLWVCALVLLAVRRIEGGRLLAKCAALPCWAVVLLGVAAWAAALQTANWEEWSDFVETLSAWMAEPKATTVTLSGADYTLPDARPGSLTATGVFAAPLDRASGYTAALLAADGTYTADALTGPLNGVYSAVTLEWDHMAADGGEGIFRRAKLTDLLAEYGADTCNGLVLVPFKCQLDDSDLTAEDYNAEGLLNYPVLADVGSIAINADTSADGLKAAKSAALWLYSNGAGEDALTETLGVVTPWNTAAGTTAVTAMQVQQVGTGILPGVALDTAAADALTANELTLQDSERHTKAERTAFVDGALAALGAAE